MHLPFTQVDNTYLNSITFQGYSDNIDKVYEMYFQLYQPESDGLFMTENVGEYAETTQRRDEQDMQHFAHDKPQGADASRLAFGVGYAKEAFAFRYGAQLDISYEMRVSKRFEIGPAITRFVESVPQRMELDRQHYLTFSNVSSYVNMDGRVVDTTAGDGLQYISATHPLAFSPITWSNSVPGAPQLSVTALESAQKLMITDVLDNFGKMITLPFSHLIVCRQDPTTIRVAKEILHSTTQITQANPGVINTFSQDYQIMTLSYLATDAMGNQDSTKQKWWFVAALNGANRLRSFEFIWETPHMNPAPAGSNNGVNIYNDDYSWGARARYGHMFLSARGLIASLAT